jgi:hypothetical protein
VSEQGGGLPHLWVEGYADDRRFERRGGPDPKVRDVERRAHGRARREELDNAIAAQLKARGELDESTIEELRAIGVVLVLEGADAAFPLKVDSLERMSGHRSPEARRPWWRLLSVTAATDTSPEKAMVWVSDEYRAHFLKRFEEYLSKDTPKGDATHRELIANIGHIRAAVLEDLWQSDGDPATRGVHWWEVWLARGDEPLRLARAYVEKSQLRMAARVLELVDRTVIWVEGRWDDLRGMPFSRVPVTEIRRPELADTVEDLSVEDRAELADDLSARIIAAGPDAPAVCNIDSGVRRSSVLLDASLAPADVHSIVDRAATDVRNHGTAMASLALLGPLDPLLLGTAQVVLGHRLEAVKMLPDPDVDDHPAEAFGLVTADAVSQPEAVAPNRSRVFCMPITAKPDRLGEPSLWSASVDALAAGVGIAASDEGIGILGPPDPGASRLFVISAGNVPQNDFLPNYRDATDNAVVEDPAQAYNALTVGAFTELVGVPDDPNFDGWAPLGAHGDVSPHSRTSLGFSHRSWPVKPDICMEGGNVLHDGAGSYDPRHPLVSLRAADAAGDRAITSANATSAATAQAARLAALAQVKYPAYWPETVRGLLTHAAQWTPIMRGELDAVSGKQDKLRLLRRYGWGVPREEALLNSSHTAVTMVSQDEFVPFTGDNYNLRTFRLHELPWPADVLRSLEGAEVTMRVTLSYFIEPTASRRGWRRRYSYASHGLRFELKNQFETTEMFVSRVNREAQDEEDEAPRPASGNDRWLIGPNQRNSGSLHQDIWEGTGDALAECGVVAVHAIGGWWKYNRRADRQDLPVRYALIVSLKTRETDVDLWTPVATELGLPIGQMIPAN